MKTKTFISWSGHTLFVKKITFKDLPKVIQDRNARSYKQFYVVKDWDDDGIVFMYLGKGFSTAPKKL